MKTNAWQSPIRSAALLLAASAASGASAGDYAARVGRPHADFTLPSLADGRPVSLSGLRGKKVLLIHFASW